MKGRTESDPRPTVDQVRAFIASTLDLDQSEVTPALGMHAVPEWSSLGHVELIVAIEDRFNTVIDGDLVSELTTVQAIERHLAGPSTDSDAELDIKVETDDSGNDAPVARPTEPSTDDPVIHRGLDGVYIDTSAVSTIDGQRGELLIRGYPIEDLATEPSCFEEVMYLVLRGRRPSPAETAATIERSAAASRLPEPLARTAADLATAHPMVALRTCLSMLGHAGPDARPKGGESVADSGLCLLAMAPEILVHHRLAALGHPRPGAPLGPDHLDGNGNHTTLARRFIERFFGREAHPTEVEALDLALRLQIEHGANASAFAARVTASAGTDLVAALVAGLATFAGSLHGGAVEGAIDGVRTIATPERAAAYVAERRAAKQPVMGFGHRVYKTGDPRTGPLREAADRLADVKGDRSSFEIMTALEAAMADYGRHGLHMNVDSYCAVIYDLIGFPDRYFSALFALSRIAGWTAHVAEQVERNVLIRPRLAYDGPPRRRWSDGLDDSSLRYDNVREMVR